MPLKRVVLGLLALPLASVAGATTITQTFGVDPSNTYLSTNYEFEFTDQFALFKPSQGTLTGVHIDATGTAVFTDSNPSVVAYFFNVDDPQGNTVLYRSQLSGDSNANRTFPIAAHGDVDASYFGDFIEGGNQTFGVLPFDFANTNDTSSDMTSFSLTNTSVTLTYTFTPSTPPPPPVTVTPEPSSCALLLTGVAGLVGAARKRFRRI